MPPDATNWIASAGIDGSVFLWDPVHDYVVRAPFQHTGSVWAMAVFNSPDGTSLLASADIDGVIRLWNPVTAEQLSLLENHSAINSLAVVPGPDGQSYLASADVDGIIRLWNPLNGKEPRLLGDCGAAVYDLAIIPEDAAGGPVLASADVNGFIRLWDPVTGTQKQAIRDRRDMLWDLTVLPHHNGSTLLASGGVDGTIHLWKVGDWTEHPPDLHHPGVIYTLAGLADGPDHVWLASGGVDGRIRLWSIDTVAAPLVLPGHLAAVRDLMVLPSPTKGFWLASAGGDGAVRLWDPSTGTSVAQFNSQSGSVLVLAAMTLTDQPRPAFSRSLIHDIHSFGPPTQANVIRTTGFGDSTAPKDLLDRTSFVEVTVDLLNRPAGEEGGDSDYGPTVVSIEGPWGTGKTTLMTLIRSSLDQKAGLKVPAHSRSDASRGRSSLIHKLFRRRFCVCQADWAMRRRANPARPTRDAANKHREGPALLSAWFNPWAHQSTEQVWAGIAREIIRAARPVLYPSVREEERYWFFKNIERLDVRGLRRQLWRRIASPLLGISALAVLAPVLAVIVASQFASKPASVHLLGHVIDAGGIALLLPLLVISLGLIHTYARYLLGEAALALPSELFRGPLMSNISDVSAGSGFSTADDPLYNAQSGYLYLLQHDISDLLEDVRTAGCELVMFVDDLDRCSPQITAEVFEAINLFISGSFPRTRFVLALDPAIVARHIDHTYMHLNDHGITAPGDPSPGWTFLRKLIQLPIILPRIRTLSMDRLLDNKLGPTLAPSGETGFGFSFEPPPSSPFRPQDTVASDRRSAEPSDTDPPATHSSGVRQMPTEPRPEPGPAPGAPAQPGRPRKTLDPASTLALEQDPAVRAELRLRLSAQPDRSARHVKRLITVWQFYVRLCSLARIGDDRDPAVRACQLVTVAEILTRWPASARQFSTPIQGISAAQLLALSSRDDGAWDRAIADAELSHMPARELAALREILADRHGQASADLLTWLT